MAALSPETLTSDQQRLQLALSLQENRRRDAENQQLIARSRFTLDGSSDPETDVQTAHARAEAAREASASEHRRARAVAMLHHHFVASRDSINQSLVEPLAAKISGYLQCLFGHGTEARVNLSKSGIESLDLIRPGGQTFHFDSLSGGAKEQVAAAARLAMAEILAADQDSRATDEPRRPGERPASRHGTVCRYATIEATSTSLMAPVTSGIMERPRI